LAMGRRYGRWEVVESLGEGGQAHTFVVRDTNDTADQGRSVLKRLKDPKRTSRFLKEIGATKRLDHPNVVRGVDVNGEADKPYLVMNRCLGGSLDRAGLAGKISVVEALRFFGGVCRGVCHAHQKGVIHRDLKPANVFLDERGNPVVGDFGLALVEGSE